MDCQATSHVSVSQCDFPSITDPISPAPFCFLLSPEEHRDADTWVIRLLELVDRGFAPQAAIADFASGLRAGHKEALPGRPCRGDVFHALYDVGPLVRDHPPYPPFAQREGFF